MTRSTRFLRAGALVAGVAAVLAASTYARAQGAPITVRFTVQPKTLVTTLVELAVEKGFFAQAGIDAKTVTVAHGPAAVTALASGSVDVATNAPEVFLALAGKGQPLKLIAGQTRQLAVLASRPGLDLPGSYPDSVRALKGKKIGVTALSSATQYLTITMLSSAGLDATDVEFIAVGTGAPQSLSARHVDAAVLTGPQIETSLMLGARTMIDLRSTKVCPSQLSICGISQVGMWAMGDWVAKNREAVTRIRKAIARADAFLHDPANAAFAKEFLGAHLSADLPEPVRAGYIEGALTVLSADFPRKDLERWINIDFRGGVITREMPVGDVFAEGTPESPQAVKDLAR
jgi:ABC-type nitrate/sulfonate/bicarbonate transport system substrate-binding protein